MGGALHSTKSYKAPCTTSYVLLETFLECPVSNVTGVDAGTLPIGDPGVDKQVSRSLKARCFDVAVIV